MKYLTCSEEDIQLPIAPQLSPQLAPVFNRPRVHTCSACGVTCTSLKELRAHKSLVHALPTCSASKTTYSRLVTARAIKKEEKPDTSRFHLLRNDSRIYISLPGLTIICHTKECIKIIISLYHRHQRILQTKFWNMLHAACPLQPAHLVTFCTDPAQNVFLRNFLLPALG